MLGNWGLTALTDTETIMFKASERMYLTADGQRLVREGDPDGATLYAAPGDEIPASAAERFGLVDGAIDAQAAAEARAKAEADAAAQAEVDAAALTAAEAAAQEDAAAAKAEADAAAKAEADAAAKAEAAAAQAKEAAAPVNKQAKPARNKAKA